MYVLSKTPSMSMHSLRCAILSYSRVRLRMARLNLATVQFRAVQVLSLFQWQNVLQLAVQCRQCSGVKVACSTFSLLWDTVAGVCYPGLRRGRSELESEPRVDIDTGFSPRPQPHPLRRHPSVVMAPFPASDLDFCLSSNAALRVQSLCSPLAFHDFSK